MKIKSFFLILAASCMLNLNLGAQNSGNKDEGFVFTTVKELPITKIQNQSRSSTCWSFSAISFFESEALKKGFKGDLNLSEMFVVSRAYFDKADKYVRLHGYLNFAPGSSFGDVLHVLKHYGAVPESVMPGLNYGEEIHVHSELDAVTKGFVESVRKGRKLTPVWKDAFDGILAAYLGEVPQTFKVDGKEYTPKSYAASLNLDWNDYIAFVSFTHQPFYEQQFIEVPDNWRWELAYNVPLDELVSVVDQAIENGYTVAWAADVSETGFNRKGVAVVPDVVVSDLSGSDQARWLGMSDAQRRDFSTNKPMPEKEITPELRQMEYDNYTTTDDHGMHIFGIAKDQTGKKYYMVKNSWGETGDYKGIWYVSEAYFKYKTIDIMINKNALSKDMKKKINIK